MRRSTPRKPGAVLPRIGQHGSLTEQTTQVLLEAILDRRFPEDRLPNEPDLAEQMGVSRTTVRAALQTLDRLGVISRYPGRGTQLRPHIDRHSMLLHRLIGFRGMLEAEHDEVRVEQSFSVVDHGSEAARAALGSGLGDAVVVNEKTYLADGQAAVHLTQEVPLRYVAEDLAEKLLRQEKFDAPPSIFEFSRFWPGREIDHTVVELVPGVVPRKEPFPLDLKPGTPFITMRETHYAATNEPVAYATEVVDDRIVRLRLVRPR